MIVLDTDVLIDLIDRRDPTHSYVGRRQAEGAVIGTTSVNVAELLRGVPSGTDDARRVARDLTALSEVPFGPRAARRFGELMHAFDRAGGSLPVVDGMVAAATLEAGGRLVTRNVRHFDRIAGLEVLTPE